ncbi:MAG TPA: hypothetical protein VFZ66_03665 [Herpetosiphonaceae bacterium]
MRGSRVELGQDRALADQLRAHIITHADVASEVVLRPLVGLALHLPAWANAGEVARAIDAEQVTAGFLDFQGRCCVAVPAQVVHLEQTAHAVAKVLHGLLEIHTPYINRYADACAEPELRAVDDLAAIEAVCALLSVNSALVRQIQAVRAITLAPELRALLDESLQLVVEEIQGRQTAHAGSDAG